MFELMVTPLGLFVFFAASTLCVVVLCLRAPLRNDFEDDGMRSFGYCRQATSSNAVLTAMMVYLAAEDPETMPRDRRIPGVDRRTGQPGTWPACRVPNRAGPGGE